MKSTLLIIFTLFQVAALGQSSNDSIEFNIDFTGCFKADTLQVTINGSKILSHQIVTSDPSDGITNIYLYQDHASFYFVKGGYKQMFPKFSIDSSLLIDITCSKESARFEIAINKGKYVMIHKCGTVSDNSNKLKFEQQPNRPYYD